MGKYLIVLEAVGTLQPVCLKCTPLQLTICYDRID